MFSSLFYNVRSVASWLPRMLLRRDSSSPGPGVVEGLSTSCRNNPSPEKCDLRREDVIIAIAEKATSAGRVPTLRQQREVTSVGRFPLTLIDQLTNISNDPGSRSMIRSRSDFLSILALIDRTCWMDAHRGLHTQSLPVT